MNLEELKAKAQAATPGEWWQLVLGSQEMPFVKFDNPRAILEFQGEWEQGITDASFLTAANPQTVLALVKAVEGISFLHVPDQYGACLGCGSNESGYAIVTWPCETAAIIEELEGEE